MTSPSLPQPLIDQPLDGVRLIATDVDGTLTTSGTLRPQLLHDLGRLQRAGIDVILVTGRSAGWVSGFAHYFPVAGAIAENGGVFCAPSGDYRLLDESLASRGVAHRQALEAMFEDLKAVLPRLQESADNAFRLTDWTFDVADLTVEELRELGDRCRRRGYGFTYSTVQCHISNPNQTKANALATIVRESYAQYPPDAVLTIGDSPNDESLFDAERFPQSVGVANIQHYLSQLQHHPRYITQAEEGDGFHQVVNHLLRAASASA